MSMDRTIGAPSFRPVLPGDGKREPRKQPVCVGDRATRYERHGATELPGERGKASRNDPIVASQVRCRRKIEKRAVDIEEKGCAAVERRWRDLASRAAPRIARLHKFSHFQGPCRSPGTDRAGA
jgi:hypothetical protein